MPSSKLKRKSSQNPAASNSKRTTASRATKAPTKGLRHPMATADSATTSQTAVDAPKFKPLPMPSPLTGKFDMYFASLPFLHSEYLPEGAKKPSFQAVYDKILFYQAKPDFSFRCALRGVDGHESTSQGRLRCRAVANPMSDEVLEPLCIVGGLTKDSVAFNAKECIHPSTVGDGAGYEAKIVLDTDESEECGCGMINSAKGILKLRKVWEAPGEPKKELFEGYWSLNVNHGPTLRRKGFGPGDSYGGPVWAVRALTKDGDEVGIDAGDGTLISGLDNNLDGVDPGLLGNSGSGWMDEYENIRGDDEYENFGGIDEYDDFY